MKKLLVLLLLVYPLSALAVTYEWTDERGTVNFTEDLGKVPKKYRKRVKVLGADETGAPQVIENNPPAAGKGGAKEASAGVKKGPEAKEETALRREYAVASGELKATQKEIADLRARLEDTSKMSRAEYVALQNTLKQAEFRAKGQIQKVEELRQQAARAGINVEGK